MTILDANVWVAFFNDQDSQYAEAQKIIENASLPIYIPEYVILETSTVIAQRADKRTANQFLDYVTSNKNVRLLITDELFVTNTIRLFLEQPTKRLSFADIALLLLSRQWPVVTFDRQLANAIKRGA